MDTEIASEIDISMLSRQVRPSPMRRKVTLALSLSLLLGIGMLAAVIAITQNASAQVAPKGQEQDASPISGAFASPNCGLDWSVVSSPNSAGDYLYGVAAVGADDVWAVGYYNVGPGHTRTD